MVWIVFTHKGKELARIDGNYYPGEIQETKALLAHDKGVKPSDIKHKAIYVK